MRWRFRPWLAVLLGACLLALAGVALVIMQRQKAATVVMASHALHPSPKRIAQFADYGLPVADIAEAGDQLVPVGQPADALIVSIGDLDIAAPLVWQYLLAGGAVTITAPGGRSLTQNEEGAIYRLLQPDDIGAKVLTSGEPTQQHAFVIWLAPDAHQLFSSGTGSGRNRVVQETRMIVHQMTPHTLAAVPPLWPPNLPTDSRRSPMPLVDGGRQEGDGLIVTLDAALANPAAVRSYLDRGKPVAVYRADERGMTHEEWLAISDITGITGYDRAICQGRFCGANCLIFYKMPGERTTATPVGLDRPDSFRRDCARFLAEKIVWMEAGGPDLRPEPDHGAEPPSNRRGG